MGDSEQIYINKPGRISKRIYPNLIRSNKKQISRKSNMIFHDDERREKQLKTATTSQEVDRQEKEIDKLRNQIRMRSGNKNQLRGSVTNLQAELEKLRATMTSSINFQRNQRRSLILHRKFAHFYVTYKRHN